MNNSKLFLYNPYSYQVNQLTELNEKRIINDNYEENVLVKKQKSRVSISLIILGFISSVKNRLYSLLCN